MNKNKRMLSPKIDVVFRMLFGEQKHERITKKLIEDVIEDCKEHFLEYMYRKHHLDIYRPMELEDDDGVFFKEYPYEYIEFSDAPLYSETK